MPLKSNISNRTQSVSEPAVYIVIESLFLWGKKIKVDSGPIFSARFEEVSTLLRIPTDRFFGLYRDNVI
jgi:hypothetical protein